MGKRRRKSTVASSENTSNTLTSPKSSKNQNKSRKSRLYLVKNAIKNIEKIPNYQIPKDKFKNALEMIEDKSLFPETKYWQFACSSSVHSFDHSRHEITVNQIGKLLQEARKCLLRRNWNDLARILCLAKPLDNSGYEIYFSVLKKYAEICLAHNPNNKNLLQNFLTGVLTPRDKDIDDVMFRKIADKHIKKDEKSN